MPGPAQRAISTCKPLRSLVTIMLTGPSRGQLVEPSPSVLIASPEDASTLTDSISTHKLNTLACLAHHVT